MSEKMEKIINITIHYGSVTKRTEAEASKINKERLNRIVRKELNFPKDKKFSLTRKSKRSKDYVPLKENADFRALARSLEVKNHLKLKVDDVAEDKTTGAVDKAINTHATKDDLVSIPNNDYKKLMSQIEDIHKSIIKGKDDEEDVNTAVHHGVYCDACNPFSNISPIIGDRFKCKECFDYDLCSKCYKSGKATNSHSSKHLMDKISVPKRRGIFPSATTTAAPAPQEPPSFPEMELPSQPPSYPCTLKEATSNIGQNCIFVDIPVDTLGAKEYETEIVDFVKNYDTVDKLKQLKEKLATFNNLLELTDNNEQLLTTIVQSYVDSQKFGKEESKNTEGLTVQVSQVARTIVFHLQNKGAVSTPKNLNLLFTCQGNENALTKFSLSMGPHSIHSNGHKRLYYNTNGIGFNLSDKYTIELIGDDNQVYASGVCTDGSGLIKLEDPKLKNSSSVEKGESFGSSSSSTSSNEAFMTPSSSTLIEQQVASEIMENKEEEDTTKDSSDEVDDDTVVQDVESSENSVPDDVVLETGEILISPESENDQESTTNETIRSSTMTLTPGFVEVDQDLEMDETAGISSDFTDDEVEEDDDDDEGSFSDEYEVLSTDDYTE